MYIRLFKHTKMINDLELTTVVDVQGTLTPLFTDEDNALLDTRIADYNEHLFRTMSMDFFNASFLSQKLAIIDRMKYFIHPDLQEFITTLQDEL